MKSFEQHLEEVAKENGFEDSIDMLSKVESYGLQRLASETAKRYAADRQPISDKSTPSEMILQILSKEKITQRQFAEACRISCQMLNDIICERKDLAVHTAFRIEKAIPLFDSRKALRAQIEITHKRVVQNSRFK